MTIGTLDGLINAMGNSSQISTCGVFADVVSPIIANIPFAINILMPGKMGLIPTPTARGSGGEIPTSATAGSLINFTNPAGTTKTYLSHFSMSTIEGPTSFSIYDRVYAASGFDGTVTSAQTITSMPALTRPGATGLGLQIVLEYYTSPVGTAQAVTVQYTNSAGVAGRSTKSVTMANTTRAGGLTFLTLQDGDRGVSSIQSVTVGTTTGTAGNFGVALYNPVLINQKLSGQSGAISLDFGDTKLPIISDSAHLILTITQTTQASASSMVGTIKLIQG